MRGVAQLYIARMQVPVHYNSKCRQVQALQLYCIDDVMVMNIIKRVKILWHTPNTWPDQLKNASAVPG